MVHNSNYGIDDSFITYRYAHNLKHGYGLVFNVGERHYGSTAMGFAIILAAFSSLLERALSLLQLVGASHLVPYADIPWVAKYLSALSLALILLVWAKILTNYHDSAKTWLLLAVTAAYVYTSAPANVVPGHETYTFIALLFLASYLFFYRGQYLASGACLALDTMIRPDSLLFFILLAGVLTYENVFVPSTRRLSALVGFIGIYLAPVVAWGLFMTLYFGTPIPTTMVAKKAQVYLGHWPIFRLKVALSELVLNFPLGVRGLMIVGFMIFLPLGLRRFYQFGARAAVSRADVLHATVWALFATGIILAYRSFRVTYWFWYLLPVHFALLFLALGFLVFSMRALTDDAKKRKIIAFATAVLVVAVVAIDRREIARGVRTFVGEKQVNIHLSSYDSIIDYLVRAEPGGTVIATGEPGSLGYRLGPKFTVVDELGLTSPEVARNIIAGNLDYPFLRWHPKYVIVSWGGRYNPHERCWFKMSYRQVGEFPHPFWQEHVGRSARLYLRNGTPEELEKAIACNRSTLRDLGDGPNMARYRL